ncbi:MAG: dimethyl sulfoxide reductase anchor subunit [Pirellulales bacterium]
MRSVGLLVGERRIPPVSPYAVMHIEVPVMKHVTTACHHCVQPGCLAGCPTQAYDKDPATGIVRHLDDQCMGCQYCLMMCPYEVPQYNAALGIVRKCDMCRQRLAADEAPACVQSCPNRAISIQIVRREDSEAAATRGEFLPDSPDPHLTIPTTTFVSRDAALGALRAADTLCDRPQHVPMSLVTMLCLTQAAVGMLVVDEALSWIGGGDWSTAARIYIGLAAAIVGIVGVHSAMLHLGRPALAVKAWLGWRTSWLSREVIVFGAWMGAATAYAASLLEVLPVEIGIIARYAAIVAGVAGIYCSLMLYAATGRTWWNRARGLVRFFGTALVLGLFGTTCVAAYVGSAATSQLAIAAAAATIAKTAWELAVLNQYFASERHALRRTARLLAGELRLVIDLRAAAACVAVAFAYLITALPAYSSLWAGLASGAVLIGEAIERTLFFAAVVPARMPGGVRA